MSSPLAVDTADLRTSAGIVDKAAEDFTHDKTTELPNVSGAGLPDGWQTLPAMRSCASAADQLATTVISGLSGWAAGVRQSAANYDAADGHAADRLRPDGPR